MENMANDRDVSEDVMKFDASQQPPDPNETDYTIPFQSMDSRVYYMDGNQINWIETAQKVDDIKQNLFMVRQLMRELMFARHDDPTAAINQVFEQVRPFIQEFGFDPTENYHKIYPDCDDFDIAIMYCVDAMEIMNVIITEITSFKSRSELISQMFETLQTPNENVSEEDHDENSVSEN